MRIEEAVPRPPADWAAEGACRGGGREQTALFYPGTGRQPEDAPWRAFCSECPVERQCLAAALLNHERFGIWGGMTERERRRLTRRLTRGAILWVHVEAGEPWAPAGSVTPTR